MRVVFDTNVLVSANTHDGAPMLCQVAAMSGACTAVFSEPTLDELGDVLVRKIHWEDGVAVALCRYLADRSVVVEITGKHGWVPRDPKDDKFIETAIVGHAAFIVSGDDDLLELKQVEGIHVVAPSEFLPLLLGPPPSPMFDQGLDAHSL